MNTKKLTEAAMLSALFVICSMMFIYTGIAYTLYLDMIVPIIVCLIYMRLDFKYTVLASITSLLIVVLAVGDIVSGIWMSQGILMGLICGYFIQKKSTIFDDLFYSAVLGCFLMVLIDVYFSKLTGYSFMKEFDEYRNMFSLNEEAMKIAFSIFVATVPMSTILITYIAALFIGKRLKILNENNTEKYDIIHNFKKVGSYICCSRKTFFIAIGYLILLELFKYLNLQVNFIYFNTVIMAIKVIAIYFVLKDSLSFVMTGMILITKANGYSKFFYFAMIYMLLVDFKSTFIILVVTSIVFDLILNLRSKQINGLGKILVRR